MRNPFSPISQLLANHQYIAKPKPNQSKAKGLVSPIKPILLSLSLLLKSAVYSARATQQLKPQPKPNQSKAKDLVSPKKDEPNLN